MKFKFLTESNLSDLINKIKGIPKKYIFAFMSQLIVA